MPQARPRQTILACVLVLLAVASVSRADDAEAPLAATVLGAEIRTAHVGAMQAEIVTRLFDVYAEEHGIEATDGDIEGFIAALHRTAEKDRADRKARIADLERKLAAGDLDATERERIEESKELEIEVMASLEGESDLTPEEAEEVAAMRRDMARSMIRHWKVNRELFATYGGRMVFQQLGPEPLDAYRGFLKARQAAGAFTIHDDDLEREFWRYFEDDSIHDFFEPGTEAQAFVIAPWERPEGID